MQLVDLKALSKKTSLSVFTCRKYVKLGMPYYRVSRKILVDLDEFEAWFQQFKAGSNRAPDNIGILVDETIERIK